MDRIKVFLDTDIGTDADDAVCLNYLLAEPRCELVGISTVGRESGRRAAMAEVLCRQLEWTGVPIAAGADEPLFDNFYWWGHHVHQAEILERWPAEREYPPNQALALMRRVIHDHPDEVVLLTVGPMTNVALLAASDPEAARRLRGVYSMLGQMQFQGDDLRQECNTMLDPVAAGAVFQRRLPHHRVHGVNVAQGHRLTMRQVNTAFADDRFAPLRQCCDIWGKRGSDGHVGLHDPVTAALLFEPRLAEYRRGRIGVKLFEEDPSGRFTFERDQLGGALYLEPSEDGPHEMGTGVDGQAVLAHILRTIAGERAEAALSA